MAAPRVAAGAGGPPAAGGRRKFIHDGRTVYEWEQNLDEVLLYIQPPPGVKAAHIACNIVPGHLKLGIKGNPPFLDEDFADTVIPDDCIWTLEDGELVINLQKAHKATTWPSVFKGHGELDPLTAQEVQKKMLLERFQQEHPGFDFSGAEVNGTVPDPRSFMGGVKY